MTQQFYWQQQWRHLKHLSKHKHILPQYRIQIHTYTCTYILKSSAAFPIRLWFVWKVFFLYSWVYAWLLTKYIMNGSLTFELYATYVNLCSIHSTFIFVLLIVSCDNGCLCGSITSLIERKIFDVTMRVQPLNTLAYKYNFNNMY